MPGKTAYARSEYGEMFRVPPLYRCHRPEFASDVARSMSSRIYRAFESAVTGIFDSGVDSILRRTPSFKMKDQMTRRPVFAWHLSAEDDSGVKNPDEMFRSMKKQIQLGCVMYYRKRLGLDEHKMTGDCGCGATH